MKDGGKNKERSPETPIETLAYELLRAEKNTVEIDKFLTSAEDVLKLVAAGAFITGGIIAPNILKLAKPLVRDLTYDESWKRYNIPFLKRKLRRLEKQKLVSTRVEKGQQVVEITTAGHKQILKYTLNEMTIPQPHTWDGRWRLVTYDVPNQFNNLRNTIAEYLNLWGFYPLERSVFLHAYPCEREISFLREYLGAGRYVRIFSVSKIENDQLYKDFFGIS